MAVGVFVGVIGVGVFFFFLALTFRIGLGFGAFGIQQRQGNRACCRSWHDPAMGSVRGRPVTVSASAMLCIWLGRS